MYFTTTQAQAQFLTVQNQLNCENYNLLIVFFKSRFSMSLKILNRARVKLFVFKSKTIMVNKKSGQ